MTPHIPLLIFAPAGQEGGAGLGVFLFQMAAFIAIIYFLLIRPRVQEEKKHKERLAQIKRGDQIVTAGGIIGQVVHVKEDELTVKSGDTRLLIDRNRVASVATPGTGEDAA